MASSFVIEPAKSGHDTLIYIDENGGRVRIHSAYDPAREAQRAAETFDAGRATLILVSGLGLGYHAAALKKKYPGLPVIAVEKDRALAAEAAKRDPSLLKGITIALSAGDAAAAVENLEMGSFRGIAHFTHGPSYRLDPGFYDGVFAALSKHLSSKVSDLLTRFEFEERWALNIIMNAPRILESVPVHRLFGKFTGYAGIIVSAGPSLRKNVSGLQALYDRALIVAVDTAALMLDRHGIEPHLIMTLDAQKHSVKHFFGLSSSSPFLLADAVSCPAIMRDYPGTTIVSTTSKFYTDDRGVTVREMTPLMDWFELHAGSPGDIQSGGSVATSAFDLLLNLGCDPVILTGQDLAYTGREIHCGGTHHNDGWIPQTGRFLNLDTINQRVIRKRKIKYVEAFGGDGTVLSDFVFDLYRSWFEDSAAKVPLTLINATEGGARIRNTVEMTLHEATEKIPPAPEPPGKRLERLLAQGTGFSRDRFIAALNRVCRTMNEALAAHAKGALSKDEVIGLAADPELERVLNPFMKKSATLLARKQPDAARAAEILVPEIIAAFKKFTAAADRAFPGMESRP